MQENSGSVGGRLFESRGKRELLFLVDDEDSNDRAFFGIEVRMDAVKLANIIAARFRER